MRGEDGRLIIGLIIGADGTPVVPLITPGFLWSRTTKWFVYLIMADVVNWMFRLRTWKVHSHLRNASINVNFCCCLLPPAYVVRREGNVSSLSVYRRDTLWCCPGLVGGSRGVPGLDQGYSLDRIGGTIIDRSGITPGVAGQCRMYPLPLGRDKERATPRAVRLLQSRRRTFLLLYI